MTFEYFDKMTRIPKIYVSPTSNLTVNRGVEARENEIGNIRFEPEQMSSSHALTECSEQRADSALAAGDAPTRPFSPPSVSDQSGSLVKVVVQKRRTGIRLPAASSPTAVLPSTTTAGGENSAVPAAVLLACPAFAALHQHSWEQARSLLDTSNRAAQPLPAGAAAAGANTTLQNNVKIVKKTKNSLWEKLRDAKNENLDMIDKGPDRIEVYHFERANDYLCARDATRITRVERAARCLRRPAAALLAELLAAPRQLLAVPLHIVLQVERCVLLAARSAITGVLQTASDQLLKPSLALTFNAIVQPPLVFAAQAAGALRDVLRPLTLALTDAVEPLARLLSSLRIVHIERQCTCTQQV